MIIDHGYNAHDIPIGAVRVSVEMVCSDLVNSTSLLYFHSPTPPPFHSLSTLYSLVADLLATSSHPHLFKIILRSTLLPILSHFPPPYSAQRSSKLCRFTLLSTSPNTLAVPR